MSCSLYETSNTVLKNALRFTGKIGVVSPTEKDDQPLLVEEAWNSKYVAVFNPLDGATNIDVGIVTGTIFGIFKEAEECLVDFGENVSEEAAQRLISTLTPSTNLVAAGYCMYSSSTILMFSMGDGVHGFTLDPSIGEFVLTHPSVRSIRWRKRMFISRAVLCSVLLFSAVVCYAGQCSAANCSVMLASSRKISLSRVRMEILCITAAAVCVQIID